MWLRKCAAPSKGKRKPNPRPKLPLRLKNRPKRRLRESRARRLPRRRLLLLLLLHRLRPRLLLRPLRLQLLQNQLLQRHRPLSLRGPLRRPLLLRQLQHPLLLLHLSPLRQLLHLLLRPRRHRQLRLQRNQPLPRRLKLLQDRSRPLLLRSTASHCGQQLKMFQLARPLSVPRLPVNNKGLVSRALNVPQPLQHRAQARNRNALCLREIVVHCQQAIVVRCRPAIGVHFLLATGQAAHDQASRCVRSKADKVAKAVPIHRVLVVAQAGKVVLVARRIVLPMEDVLALCPRARALVPVNLDGPECFQRRRPTECLPRQSRGSPSTRAGRRSANAPLQTSARWKGSASFIQRASVLERAIAVRRQSSLRQSRALHATSTSRRALRSASSRKSSTCALKSF